MIDLIGADDETGGLHPSIHALLSIGACCSWSGETFEVYITPESQPGKTVEAQAAEKNGYTPELWAERGAVDLETAVRRFADWVQTRRDERKHAKIVCHHLAFDKGFLLEAERVTGIEMPGRYDWRCSLLKLAELMDEGLIDRGSASLDRLKELSGWCQPRDEAHNALQDAQIAMHGYWWLLERAKDVERALSELATSRLQRITQLDALLNTPEFFDFSKAVPLEAAHQKQRWDDANKLPQDWFWLLGYLGGKALRAAISRDTKNALHHCISTAAACCSWHAQIRSTLPVAMEDSCCKDTNGEHCGHTYAEHDAFDAGAQAPPEEVNPHTEENLREAWETGRSAVKG